MPWLAILTLTFAYGLSAQPVEYQIQRASSKITIDGKLDDPAWRAAPPASDFIFNWFSSGEKEATVAKLLWDDENLYVSWRCTDRHISAYELKRHGAVSRDDCVEIFLSPNPAKVKNYYTFEINAIGTMLNRCRTDWWTGPATWDPEGVVHRTSLHGLAKKDESPDDSEWAVELAIPFANFRRDAAHTPPRDGDEWRLNLMRTGGKTNAQQSTWSPVAGAQKSFHTPENFGKVVFVAQAPLRRPVRSVSATDAAGGRELYNKSCTMCHGLDGAAGDRAPALGAQRRYLRTTDEDLFDAIKNGIKGTMMPASPMADGDVRKIITYIRSLRATASEMQVAGNVQKGESVFHGKGGCSKCHMLNGHGGLVGPELSNVGAQLKLEDLKAALMAPKPAIPRGYQPVTVKTTAGRSIRGVVKNEHNSSLQILGLDDRLHLLLREEIRDIQYEEKSLMPSGFEQKLDKDEFQDLVAFLSRQAKQPRRRFRQ
jgi:putative heme-binding domain-containing protein